MYNAGNALGWVGLEPTTNRLKADCSSAELPTQPSQAVSYRYLCTPIRMYLRMGAREDMLRFIACLQFRIQT